MGVYEAARDAVKFAASLDNAELTTRLLEVQKMALDQQDELLTSRRQIDSLEGELAQLKAKGSLVFAKGHNYLIEESGDSKRHFCSVAWDKDGTRYTLPHNGFCNNCKVYHR